MSFETGFMNETDWWKSLFDQKYLDTYLSDFTPERTSQEVDFVIKTAQLKPEDRILDLACGHGRHSIELARRSFNHITGLDYSEPFIAKAKQEAEQAGVNVNFQTGDMRNLPFNGEFDVVLHLFTAFGYFDNEGNQQTLYEISEALKPGGRYLIDVVSGEAVKRRFQEKGEKEKGSNLLKIPRRAEMGGKMVDEIEWFDPEKQLIHTHREWIEDGVKKEYDYYLRVYTIPQYKEMLTRTGLEFKEVWGDFKGNPHDTDGNFRTIIFAQKPSS